MLRANDRSWDEVRPITIQRGYTRFAEGSVLITMGDTKVLCTASVENGVPPFLRGQGIGWLTAEYSMLPRATQTRTPREATKGKLGGRTMEIQRMIGRALRSVVDRTHLGERTIWVDCDVLQADGGTRTAAITGAYVAVYDALLSLWRKQETDRLGLRDLLGAVSVGIVNGQLLLDLDFSEDSQAQVDLNIVATGQGNLVEIQGAAEGEPFARAALYDLLDLAHEGIAQVIEAQKRALGSDLNYITGSADE